VLSHFYPKYGDKYITITGTCLGLTKTFNALIADTCGNQDCSGCCARNANPTTGYLIDMEYHTILRNFGTTLCADVHTQLRFTIDLNQPLAIPNCGSAVGTCNNPQACCSKDNYCGYGLAFCGAGCQSAYGPCDGPGACGGINGKACAAGQCCSQYGFCGSGTEQCGFGCQGDFGSCYAIPTAAPFSKPPSRRPTAVVPQVSGAPIKPPHPTRSPIVGLPDNPANSFKPSWPLLGYGLLTNQPSIQVNPFDMNFTAPTSGATTVYSSSSHSLLLLTFLIIILFLRSN
jgi:hypothetical protein